MTGWTTSHATKHWCPVQIPLYKKKNSITKTQINDFWKSSEFEQKIQPSIEKTTKALAVNATLALMGYTTEGKSDHALAVNINNLGPTP